MTEKITYIVIVGHVISSEGRFEIVYDWDGERFSTLKKAIKHGFTLDVSDDFNVLKVQGDVVLAKYWMEEKQSEPQHTLEHIGDQIFP